MKCGWCGTTMLMSQLLSENVVSAPVPGLLRVNAVSELKSSGDLSVMVKDSQCDSGTRSQKLFGLPKWGESWASDFQSSHEPSFEWLG